MRAELRPRSARDRLIVALDLSSVEAARCIVLSLGDAVSFYKIGMQLVFAGGLALIPELTAAGKRVFLDMKLLDIDNTVTGGIESISGLGAVVTTVHAYPAAMRAAAAARDRAGGSPALLAVTVLTSMDDADLDAAGYRRNAAELVAARAADARAAGMDGIVCSPKEAAAVRKIVGPEMAIVTPGVRPEGSASGDQKRAATPGEAVAAGADFLVVGRPVTGAANPPDAANRIVAQIEAALQGVTNA
jgi:orotidine-5'-phosphate decarboxylase